LEEEVRLNAALIGCGYWGGAIARTIGLIDGLNLASAYDRDPAAADSIARSSGARQAHSLEEALGRQSEVAIIATPPETHYPLARQCLTAGKHVFVEKPFTTSVAQARALLAQAQEAGLTCMVDHTYAYSEPVRKVREMIDGGELGEIVYVIGRRINLGVFQFFTDVIWDLAVHDLAILDYLLGLEIENVQVSSMKYGDFPTDAMANIALDLNRAIHVNLTVSWLSPVKVRELIVGGTDRMVVFDDTKRDKLLVFDKGVVLKDNGDPSDLRRQLAEYRYGDTSVPTLPDRKPLTSALAHFADCIRCGAEPLTGASSILSVTKALETISNSRRPVTPLSDRDPSSVVPAAKTTGQT
jgi:predicted dehydrogenase